MYDLLNLNGAVGRGQENDEDDVFATDAALREISAYEPPPEFAREPQRYITEPVVNAIERVQEQNGLEIDGYAEPGGPTEKAINNTLLKKPRGAGLLYDFDMSIGDTVGNGFKNAPRDVETVKRALGGLGYLPENPFDRPSGFIEESTTAAIKRFQGDNGLSTDGWLQPSGETEAALRHAVDQLAQAKLGEWLAYQRRAALPGQTNGFEAPHSPSGLIDLAARLLRNPRGAHPNDLRLPAHGVQLASGEPHPDALVSAPDRTGRSNDEGIGSLSLDPNANFGSWSFKRDAVLPEGVVPPPNPLKPDVLGAVPTDGMGETDAGIDRKREIRFLISRLYRVGARDADGRPRLSDDAFERYVAAAKEHIRPEHSAIFEFTARAVRAGVLDWHTAATRLAAYYAPGTTGEKIVDFILDFTPVAGQVKAVRELVEAVQDAIDAREYGDQKAFDVALGKATGAAAAIAIPGALAGASHLLRKEAHHLVALYLGGRPDGPTVTLSAFWHRIRGDSVHAKMRRYFSEHYPDLVPRRGYRTTDIVGRVVKERRRGGLDAFYRTFEHSSLEHEQRIFRKWLQIFPESGKYFLD